MAPKPVYVETEEEIPEVIERLRASASTEIALVLPARSRMGQSRFNFELLGQFATRLDRRIAIITADAAARQMAEETGFPVFPSVDQYEQGPPPPEPEGGGLVLAAAGAGSTGALPPASGAAPRIRVGGPAKLTSKAATEVRVGRLVLYLGAVLILMVGLAAAAVYVPSASVTLVADAIPFKTEATVQAGPSATANPVRIRTVHASKTASSGFRATGQQTLPGAVATGAVNFNNACPFWVTILNGQRLRSVGGIQFAVKGGDLVVKNDGLPYPSVITATSPGANGNLGAGTILIIEGNSSSCLTVNNPAPTSGGADEQKQTIIQQSDYEAGRSALEQGLRQQITDDLTRGVQAGEKLADQVIFSAPDFNTDHRVGEVVGAFSGTMTMTAEGSYYVTADVEKAFADQLNARVPSDKTITADKPAATYQVSSLPGSQLTFRGTVSGFVAPRIDFQQVKRQLTAKPLGQAEGDLRKLPVRSVQIAEKPARLPLMPLVTSRISVRYVVTEQAVKAPPA